MRALAKELVGLQPDIILTGTTPETAALQRETRTIPIVFAVGADPVASGIVARLDRPGENVTGFARLEPTLGGKWLELLSEIAPGLKRAAIMFNPDLAPAVSTYMPSLETAARSLKVEPIIAHVHSDAEIETAIIALGREPGGGLVVMLNPFTSAHRAPARGHEPTSKIAPERRAKLRATCYNFVVSGATCRKGAPDGYYPTRFFDSGGCGCSDDSARSHTRANSRS
jgi:hypothetical protein